MSYHVWYLTTILIIVFPRYSDDILPHFNNGLLDVCVKLKSNTVMIRAVTSAAPESQLKLLLTMKSQLKGVADYGPYC